MDDETTRITVSLRLGIPLCRSHECSNCGAFVDDLAAHGLSLSEGRHPHHASGNPEGTKLSQSPILAGTNIVQI